MNMTYTGECNYSPNDVQTVFFIDKEGGKFTAQAKASIKNSL